MFSWLKSILQELYTVQYSTTNRSTVVGKMIFTKNDLAIIDSQQNSTSPNLHIFCFSGEKNEKVLQGWDSNSQPSDQKVIVLIITP